ncbi:extensin family protein [Microvirga sp. BT291]|nr:extensin family protein [Microvirga pudoricolor]
MAAKLVQPSAYMSRASKIDGPGACGMDYPFRVTAFSAGTVGLKSRVTLACPIIPSIEGWLDEYVKPAALLYFGVPLLDIKAGSYSCRPRNNQSGAKTSEHAFGNALDVMAFVLADGREVTVVKGWRGESAEQEFLREVFTGACQSFTTVLGPGSDRFHYDHLHLDLARHDPRGTRRICKPILKFEPRIDPRRGSPQLQAAQPPSADLPYETDEDGPVEEAGGPRASDRPYAADLPSPRAAYTASQPARPPGQAASQASASPAYGAAPSIPQTYAPPSSRPAQGGSRPLVLSPQGIY